MGLFSKKSKFPEIEKIRSMGMDAKRWMTEGDSEVCSVCKKLNGQIRPLDKPFDLPGGRQVMCPSDPSFKHSGRCRCSLLPTRLSRGDNGTYKK